MADHYEYIRENDLTLTPTLLNLQRRHRDSAVDTMSEEAALTVVKETDAGVVLRGSRLLGTLGPFSDELVIYHAGNHRMDEETKSQSFALSIP